MLTFVVFSLFFVFFFFFNDTATTEIYTLSLHDALPISVITSSPEPPVLVPPPPLPPKVEVRDRKSTRLNSSHSQISYAVFCLKKKKKTNKKQSLYYKQLTNLIYYHTHNNHLTSYIIISH